MNREPFETMPDVMDAKQTDVDSDTVYMEFEIAKGCLSFRLTAPYSEERRRAASELAKQNEFGCVNNLDT